MQSSATSIEAYLKEIPEERKITFTKLRETILKNIPEGFSEQMSYGMVGYIVPHSIYPSGYHCDPKLPLPFISIASQKNFIAVYHMGIYANPELLNWFLTEYPKHRTQKIDMGKSCIRFKKMNQIPFDLIAALVQKMSVQEWITCYESNFKKKTAILIQNCGFCLFTFYKTNYLLARYSKTFFSILSSIFEISAFTNFSPRIFSYNSIYLSETVSMYSSVILGICCPSSP